MVHYRLKFDLVFLTVCRSELWTLFFFYWFNFLMIFFFSNDQAAQNQSQTGTTFVLKNLDF